MFGGKAIRHMWQVANGLDNADLSNITNTARPLSFTGASKRTKTPFLL